MPAAILQITFFMRFSIGRPAPSFAPAIAHRNERSGGRNRSRSRNGGHGVLDPQRPRPRERRTLRWRERDPNRRSPQNSDTFEIALFAAGEPTLLPKAPAVRTLLPPPFQAEPCPLRPGARRQRGPARSADARAWNA